MSSHCAVCARPVERALACVDAQSGELLCPVHFRERHFKKIFAQRRLERWSTLSTPAAAPTPQPRPSPMPTPITSARGQARYEEGPAGVIVLARRHWRRWQRLAEGWRAAIDNADCADTWRLRRKLRKLRAHRSTQSLVAQADARRTSRCFAALLSLTLWRAFCVHEAFALRARTARTRGLLRWRAHAALQQRLLDGMHTALVRAERHACHRALFRWIAASRMRMLNGMERSVAAKLHWMHSVRSCIARLQAHARWRLHEERRLAPSLGGLYVRRLLWGLEKWRLAAERAAEVAATAAAAVAIDAADAADAAAAAAADAAVTEDATADRAAAVEDAAKDVTDAAGAATANAASSTMETTATAAAAAATDAPSSSLVPTPMRAVAAKMRASDAVADAEARATESERRRSEAEEQQAAALAKLAESEARVADLAKALVATQESLDQADQGRQAARRERDVLLSKLSAAMAHIAALGRPPDRSAAATPATPATATVGAVPSATHADHGKLRWRAPVPAAAQARVGPPRAFDACCNANGHGASGTATPVPPPVPAPLPAPLPLLVPVSLPMPSAPSSQQRRRRVTIVS